MVKTIRELNKYLVTISVFWFLFFLVEYMFILVAPSSHWFEYLSIESYQEVYQLWEEPTFISVTNINRWWPVERNDYIRCHEDSNPWVGFTRYTSFESKGVLKPTGWEIVSKPWRFESAWPLEPSTCYLQAEIILPLKYDIKKIQTIKSAEFRFE